MFRTKFRFRYSWKNIPKIIRTFSSLCAHCTVHRSMLGKYLACRLISFCSKTLIKFYIFALVVCATLSSWFDFLSSAPARIQRTKFIKSEFFQMWWPSLIIFNRAFRYHNYIAIYFELYTSRFQLGYGNHINLILPTPL